MEAPIKFADVLKYNKDLPHQLQAVANLDERIAAILADGYDYALFELLNTFATDFRNEDLVEGPVLTEKEGISIVQGMTFDQMIAAINSRFRTAHRPNHNGIDIPLATGTGLRSPIDGTVTIADGVTDPDGFGNLVQVQGLDEQNRRVSVAFGHLDDFGVIESELIEANDIIGWSGNTGRSTGPHVHFEVARVDGTGRIIEYLDPEVWLAVQGPGELTGLAYGEVVSAADYRRIQAFILEEEGGLSDHADDAAAAGLLPGETYHTNRGVTQATYTAWRQKNNLDVIPVRLMNEYELDQIFADEYWTPAHCSEMQFPLAAVQADLSYMASPPTSIQWLQRRLGVQADGVWGPKTQAALAPADQVQTAMWVIDDREAYVEQRRNSSFYYGWKNRLRRLRSFIATG